MSDPASRKVGRVTEQASRTASPVDAIADAFLDRDLELNPIAATFIGVAGYDDRLTDFSPAANEERAKLRRRTLAELEGVTLVDDVDRVTIGALQERLGLDIEIQESGANERSLNNIASPLQEIREVFDLMPTDTPEHWETIVVRAAAVPKAIASYSAALRTAKERGDVVPIRQVRAGIEQASKFGGPDGFWITLARDATAGGSPLPGALRAQLEAACAKAADAYVGLATTLHDELLPVAPEADAIGPDRYPLFSRYFVGATVDLAETYAWGQEELARIVAEQQRVADLITPGGTVADAIAALDTDPARVLSGTDELQEWMQEQSDAAIAALVDVHFDIPEPLRRLECRIAPTRIGGVYYTAPSEDFSRPGRMWWSVPEGVETFKTWRELTTVYHEGVPGHHLQIGQTVYRRELLNRWRRLACWVSGHGEGWALYAERFMGELGFLDDSGAYLGMLNAQAMRAARVVVDIGVHCEFPAPEEVGGGDWTYDKAWTFFRSHVAGPDEELRFELDRYMGWPGQAPSYKIGERLWLQARQEAQAREGAAFDLKVFHRRALDLGSVGLDVLRAELSRPQGLSPAGA
jgi:uncharacterized protein (DUF885 family)